MKNNTASKQSKKLIKHTYIKRILIIALLVISLLFAIFCWFVSTEKGLQILVGWLNDNASVQVNKAEGRLIGPLLIEGLNVETDAISYSQKKITLNWSPASLFSRKIVIDSLVLDNTHLTIKKKKEESVDENISTPPSLVPEFIGLPLGINVQLKDLIINNIHITSDKDYYLNTVELKASSDENQYQLNKLSIDSDWLNLQFHGVIGTHKPFLIQSHADLKLSIDQWVEGHYADIVTSLHIEGNIDKLTLNQSVQAPYNITIDLKASELLDDLYVDLKTNLQKTALNSISSTLPNYSVSTDFSLTGSPEIFAINSKGELIIDNDIQLDYNLEANNDKKNINIQQLKLITQSNTDDNFIELSGNVDFSEKELSTDLISHWQGFAWPLSQQEQAQNVLFYSPEGTLSIKGPIGDLQLSLDTTIGKQGLVKANIQSKNVLTIERSIDAEIIWNDLQYPLITSENSFPTYNSKSGHLLINGNQDDYKISLNSDIATSLLSEAAQGFVDGTINILGEGNRTSFNLSTLSIKPNNKSHENGYLLSTGDAQFTEDFSTIRAQLDIKGDQLNPVLLSEQWPGDLDIAIKLDAQKNDADLNININKLLVDGQLRNLPVKAEAKALLSNQALNVEMLSLISGNSRLALSGDFSEAMLDGQWDFISENLTDLYPEASGLLSASGTIHGTVKEPIAKATISASDIVIDTLKVEDINAKVDIDLSSSTSQNYINIKANTIVTNDFTVHNITTQLDGSLDDHRFHLTTDTEKGQFVQTLSGNFLSDSKNFEWRFLLENLQITPLELRPWQLKESVAGLYNNNKIVIDPLCLHSDNNLLCASTNADLSTNNVHTDIDIHQLEYSYFSSLLGDAAEIDRAGITGTASFSVIDNSISELLIALTTKEGLLRFPITEPENTQKNGILDTVFTSLSKQKKEGVTQKKWVDFLLHQGKLDASYTKNNLNLDIDLPLDWSLNNEHEQVGQHSTEKNQGLHFSLKTNGSSKQTLAEQNIMGEMIFNAYDLDPIITLFPQLLAIPSEQEKVLRTTANITGTLNKPRINGSLTLDNLALTVIDAGITLKDVQADIASNELGLIEYKAQVSSLPISEHNASLNTSLPLGLLTIEGTADLQNSPELTLTIEANQFQVVNTSEVKITASPSLKINANQERIDINGKVLIPNALIAPSTIENNGVTVSSDQVIIDSDAASDTVTPDVYADVRIELGDNVRVESFGFKGDITGAMDATSRPNSPTIGTGELAIIDGEYRAYGQGLVIEQGRIIFSGGNIEQPGIDIKAKRNPAENVTVGIIAQGDINEPSFVLFSEPNMTQTEQLSWLILGKELNDSTAGEGNALNQLALSIGLASGDDFLQNFNGKLGIDSIAIETGSGEAGAYSDNEQASLTLGKYLTPKLYLSYGIGLFDALNTVKLEYLINQSLKLATESSSAASGADIIYNIGGK